MNSESFKKGDRVSVINDNIFGIIKVIQNEVIVITSDDGFDLSFNPNELILEPETWLDNSDLVGFWSKKKVDQIKKQKNIAKKRSKTGAPPLIVDLHIDKLIKNPKKLKVWEILDYQINSAKNQLDWAISKRKERIIFIHGIGEGILKAELETLLRRYDNIKFYPANPNEFGAGAIEVYRMKKISSSNND